MRQSCIEPQHLRQERDHRRAHHRAPEGADAAEHHDDEDLGRAEEAELGGVDEERLVGVEPAADAGDEGARGRRRPP